MEYDEKKVDDAVLAPLYLTMFKDHGVVRAWKGHDWDALNRLHGQGFIHDPKSKAKSVVVTRAGEKRARKLFASLFGKSA